MGGAGRWRGVVNPPATRDIASLGRDLVGRGAVGVNLLALSPQFGEVSLVRLRVQRLWSNRNASSFPQQARRSHACPLLRGAHTGPLPHSSAVGGRRHPKDGFDPNQRGVAAGNSCGELPQGFREEVESTPYLVAVSYRSRDCCHLDAHAISGDRSGN